MTTNAFDYNYR